MYENLLRRLQGMFYTCLMISVCADQSALHSMLLALQLALVCHFFGNNTILCMATVFFVNVMTRCCWHSTGLA